jgi:hypothetical protein
MIEQFIQLGFHAEPVFAISPSESVRTNGRGFRYEADEMFADVGKVAPKFFFRFITARGLLIPKRIVVGFDQVLAAKRLPIED